MIRQKPVVVEIGRGGESCAGCRAEAEITRSIRLAIGLAIGAGGEYFFFPRSFGSERLRLNIKSLLKRHRQNMYRRRAVEESEKILGVNTARPKGDRSAGVWKAERPNRRDYTFLILAGSKNLHVLQLRRSSPWFVFIRNL
jgi:hypothetical protein